MKGEAYNQIWCVFDKDDFPNHNFDNAIQRAKSNDLKLAYSNEAFEIWFLLHFEFYNNPIPRQDYKEKLTNKLGKEYLKNDIMLYKDLENKQEKAIKNAKQLFELQLLELHKGKSHAALNPVTTVFLLVEELNKWCR